MTDGRKAYYWLSLSGLSVQKQNRLLEEYGGPLEIFARIEDKKLSDAAGKNYARMKRFADESYITGRLSELVKQNIRLLTKGMDGYPDSLAQSEVNPPQVIYYRGNASLLTKDCFAVVGTRRSDEYGKQAAKMLVSRLAKALVIVTGHATGIDTYAARYALESGGSVIIIAGCGLNKLDLPDFIKKAPEENKLILSEYEPDMISTKFTFPERNRLIAGLSLGVAVIEAGDRSGALITAREANEQGRNVYAVPGSILSPKCAGTNKLIQDGATALLSAQTVFDDLLIQYSAGDPAVITAQLTEEETEVCRLLDSGKTNIDALVAALGRPAYETLSLLTEMENSGKIRKLAGNNYEITR